MSHSTLVVVVRCALLLLVLTGRASVAQLDTSMRGVVDAIVHDVCSKRVALLTEPSTHDFGRTVELKGEVVRRLVNECGYTTFLIESGIYDFLNIGERIRAHQSVDDSMVTAAIGGIWANRDMATLVPFLTEKANAGALTLGGLDDQLGRGTWAQRGIPEQLAGHLTGTDRAECLATLRRHTLWQYTAEASYGPADKARILGCVDKMDMVLSAATGQPARENDRAMLNNLRRTLARELRDPAPDLGTRTFNERDSSMYLNFRWWLSRIPAPSKVIIWTATVHGAKSLSGVPGNEKIVSEGAYLHREFGNDAFVVAFSAARGTARFGRQPERVLSPAPDSSLEGRTLANTDAAARYVGPTDLRKAGVILARPFGGDFKRTNWADVFDGIVVFREERPPRL